MKRCSCGDEIYAIHREDMDKPFREQRKICRHLYDYYTQYIGGTTDWVLLR